MEIIKHGNRIDNIYVCPTCGCEFRPLDTETYFDDSTGRRYSYCPECGFRIFTKSTYIDKEIKQKEKIKRVQKEVLNYIDFDKIHKTMIALDWKWAAIGNYIPTVDDIKNFLSDKIENVLKYKQTYSSGGFTVEYHCAKDDLEKGIPYEGDEDDEWINVRFSIEECEAVFGKDDFIDIF